MFDRDCARSEASKKEEKCKVLDGFCRSPEELEGNCGESRVLSDGACRHFDCKKSEVCELYGHCSSTERRVCTADGVCSRCSYTECEATTSDMCLGARVCTGFSYGLGFGAVCEEVGDCEVKPVEDYNLFCAPQKTKTLQCATRKMCVLKDSWCARKAACKEEGLCAINEEPSPYKRSRVSEYLLKCRPTLGEHCEKSQACRERGACGLVPLVHSFYCGLLRAYKATSLLEREGVRGRGQVLLQRWGLCALSV